tara:strand:+ start:23961 stop:24272 length:312 start_codon:yes stop_codon:yes gene_type:complete
MLLLNFFPFNVFRKKRHIKYVGNRIVILSLEILNILLKERKDNKEKYLEFIRSGNRTEKSRLKFINTLNEKFPLDEINFRIDLIQKYSNKKYAKFIKLFTIHL